MPENTIRSLFVARTQQLLNQFEGSKSIAHGPTVGAMREEYLKSMLRDMLPSKFAPESGFIADLHGHISPQLDMIFFDRSELPAVSLVGDTVIVPVEVALLTAEIKSTVKTDTLQQVAKQRRDIEEGLKPAYIGAAGRRPPLVPTIIFGFDSDLSSNNLQAWIRETPSVAGLCIVSKLAVFPTFPREIRNSGSAFGQAVLDASTSETSEMLLTFVGAIYRLLCFLALHNSTIADPQILDSIIMSNSMWPWEAYLSEFHFNHLQPPE